MASANLIFECMKRKARGLYLLYEVQPCVFTTSEEVPLNRFRQLSLYADAVWITL